MDVLVSAWHVIKSNAETSRTKSTRESARQFGANLPSNLKKIQSRLRQGYVFKPGYGATPPKGSGKPGKRPIFVAKLDDRIVQRAILDVLQDATEFVDVQAVLNTRTSVGGIRGRGVSHAIKIFDECVSAGDRYVAGSDISGFFTKISQADVLKFLDSACSQPDFTALVRDALRVDLENADKLSIDDRKLFPIGLDGVAQGCPLSALAGNIVLREFDEKLNGRGITCVRYIDDFIIIGRTMHAVESAMRSAGTLLGSMGMSIYDPKIAPTKAFIGKVGDPHTFLGYELIPGVYPPSKQSIANLESSIHRALQNGRKSISKSIKGKPMGGNDRLYIQTLVGVDSIIKGWRASFKESNCPAIFASVDARIDDRIENFPHFFRSRTASLSKEVRRRVFGVTRLS